MANDDDVAPIIIIKKKKIVAGDGHHGGAWKVAYADFVTAMMAFFLLMWLLNATTEKQRKGIADYFSPTIAITRMSGGGDGSFGGTSVFSEIVLPQVGTGATSLKPTAQNQARGSQSDNIGEEQEATYEVIEELLLGRGGESDLSDDTFKHIVTKQTDEGVVIELFATEDRRIFDQNQQPSEMLIEFSLFAREAAKKLENQIALEAYVSSFPLVLADNPAWDISTERVQNLRELFENKGFSEGRIKRVTAYADKDPNQKNPMSVQNNRVKVIFLREM